VLNILHSKHSWCTEFLFKNFLPAANGYLFLFSLKLGKVKAERRSNGAPTSDT